VARLSYQQSRTTPPTKAKACSWQRKNASSVWLKVKVTVSSRE
jgi:hypothetical protein